jgi:hypothetical protein
VLVNCMIQDAIKLGTSDLHIKPWETVIVLICGRLGVWAGTPVAPSNPIGTLPAVVYPPYQAHSRAMSSRWARRRTRRARYGE